MLETERGGTYYRVFKPEWNDPLDTSFSKRTGGRWNAPGAFGILYLNATLEVAAANARLQHRGRAIKLFDLRPDKRPKLLQVDLPTTKVVDVASPEGVAAANLPGNFPYGIGHHTCQKIGQKAYRGPFEGIACRSNAECTPTSWLGEELALFDKAPAPKESGPRRTFQKWYPDPQP